MTVIQPKLIKQIKLQIILITKKIFINLQKKSLLMKKIMNWFQILKIFVMYRLFERK